MFPHGEQKRGKCGNHGDAPVGHHANDVSIFPSHGESCLSPSSWRGEGLSIIISTALVAFNIIVIEMAPVLYSCFVSFHLPDFRFLSRATDGVSSFVLLFGFNLFDTFRIR